VAAGGLVAATAAWASKVGWLKRWPEVPPGDLWVPIERAMAIVATRIRQAAAPTSPADIRSP
jgi:hypothetical protein